MGPTKVFKTMYEQPKTIRGQFGTSDTRNATHGSDSVENAKIEMKFFFPEFDIARWCRNEKDIFINNEKQFVEQFIEHRLIKKKKD